MGVSDSEAEIVESERKNKRSGIRWRGLMGWGSLWRLKSLKS